MTDKDPNKHYVGKVVRAVSARLEERVTEPPPRYTQDTLVADMLAAHKFATGDKEKQILKETEGLGTSRTREPTITALIKRQFLESKKVGKRHEVRSSGIARSMIDALPDALTGVATTARWEVAFKMIERGQATPEKVRMHLAENLNHVISIAKASVGKVSLPIGNSGNNLASSKKLSSTGATPSKAIDSKATASGTVKKWFN